MTAPLTVADVCDRAATIIERNGWHRGGYYRANAHSQPADCPVDLLGALSTATLGQPVIVGSRDVDARLLLTDAQRAVCKFLGDRTLADWNDAEGRTYTEVIAALRGTAQAERERAAAPA